jgi:hypothetical protein
MAEILFFYCLLDGEQFTRCNTLLFFYKRSKMPKYSGGATPVPMEPTSIIPNATAAHTAIPLVRLSR